MGGAVIKAIANSELAGFAFSATGRKHDQAAAEQTGALLEQARILSLLHDIGKELTAILDLETLVRAVATHVKRLVDFDLFDVMILNSETGRLEHSFSQSYDDRMQPRLTLALGEGLCGAAALQRRPVLVNRVASDPRYISCSSGLEVQSELVVPLIFKDRVLGVLDLESLRPDAFTEENERMLTTLAATVAIALENARLYDQLRRAEQRKTEDLERAREVQVLLLPETTPNMAGADIAVLYLPARELGGDFYDFLPYGDGRIGIAVGDVAGKGSAAALLAALGVGLLREHAVHQPSPPAELLADLNEHLLIPGSSGRFIAMSFSVYDSAAREFQVASSGFPPPILIRNGKAQSVAVGGVPLGLLPGTKYEEARIRLQPGDVVVLCSDGICDQADASDEQFGTERLLALLAGLCGGSTSEEIAARIIRAVNDHAGENASCIECSDDRTIVVLRVVGDESRRNPMSPAITSQNVH